MKKQKCGKQPSFSDFINELKTSYNLTDEEIFKLIDKQMAADSSFAGAVSGGMSEIAFKQECDTNKFIKSCEKITDRKRKGDFEIITNNNQKYSVEVKECNTNSVYEDNGIYYGDVGTNRSDSTNIIFEDGSTVYCNYFLANQYDILVVPTININGKFDFYYILEKDLERVSKSKKIPEKHFNDFLKPTQKIDFSSSKLKRTLKEVIE